MSRSPSDKDGYATEANNLYIKNIPDEYKERDLVKLFSQFGHVKSSALKNSKLGKFGFICFEDPHRKDLSVYGPKCAKKAIKALNGRRYYNNQIHNKRLYVGPAMKREERREYIKNTIHKKDRSFRRRS